ncbi:calcium-binding protein [Streptomyces sp. MZ04]|uniref:calcium-binding protein n=1 Tax=Streptomyces sp. MZ04 TaxID=2559236 RepID=UPI00107E99C3|nr:calcium-binding protein [Streptomyces sp. MZ04]TGB05694.1 calcium-binding protein [Streptomyces sp. MZ04]
MRIRATVAALTGTLALSALAVPAAQAVDGPSSAPRIAAQGANVGDTEITKVSVNGGKNVVVGTTNKVQFTVAVTATDPEGIAGGSAFLYHGGSIDTADGVLAPDDFDGTCKVVDATTSTCSVTVIADPQTGLYNGLAGSGWKVYAAIGANDGDSAEGESYASDANIQRNSRLTTNASPEPVKKGKTLTVTGALTRANWDTFKYAGYTNQSVKLQYKKKGATSYTTLKTITSGASGALKTTVTASADGYYRYVFAGTSTTPATTSTSDFVDVQ